MVVEGAVKIKGDSKLLESITEMYGKRYGGSRKVMIEPLYREFNALGGGVKELQIFFEYVDRLFKVVWSHRFSLLFEVKSF